MKKPRSPEGEYQTVPPEAKRPIPKEEEAKPEEEIVEVKKTPEGRPDIEVTFYYIIHNPENAAKVAERVEDAGLILLEATGGTKESASFWDMVLASTETDLTVQELKDQLLQSRSFFERFMGEMIKRKKRVEFIDVTEEAREYQELEKTGKIEEQIRNLIYEGKVQGAFKEYPLLLKQEAKANKAREDFVARQLRERFREIKLKERFGVKWKKIAVIQGAIHTPTYHTLKREEIPFPSRYVFPTSPYLYPPRAISQRRVRFHPEKEVLKEDLLRNFVEEFLLIPGAVMLQPEAPLSGLDIFTGELARRLSAKELDEVAERFSHMQRGSISPLSDNYPQEGLTLTKVKRLYASLNASILVKELAEKHGITIKTEAEETSEKAS